MDTAGADAELATKTSPRGRSGNQVSILRPRCLSNFQLENSLNTPPGLDAAPFGVHTSPMDRSATAFEPAIRHAADELRASLLGLYASVGADPANPQEVARRFGVNKTLTWTISRIVSSDDPIATLASAPGVASLRSLISMMEQAGAPAAAVARVWSAVESVDKTVEVHVGDRSTLQLVADGMSPSSGDHLEASRRLAYRGNSGLWGVQARLRTMTAFLAPSADNPDSLDVAIVRGLVGLRRLRASLRWPIIYMRRWGTAMTDGPLAPEPFEAPENGNGPSPLLRRFSTLAPSDIEEARTSDGVVYTLASGPIGNLGAVDCYVADFERGTLPRYASGDDRSGEIGANITVPSERLVLDLIVHESLQFALTPKAAAHTDMLGVAQQPGALPGRIPIPVPSQVARMPGKPPTAVISSVPAYGEIVDFVFDRLGWNRNEFEGRRLEMTYPPFGSMVSLSFSLPAKP